MPVDTGRISHRPEMHRRVSWKQPCRLATTANITIATALNAGDVIDNRTLGLGDRVLVKDQTAGEQNGIYVVGPTPARDFDMDTDDEVIGALIYVIDGDVNSGRLFRCTDLTVGVLGTTAIGFAPVADSSAPVDADYLVGTAHAGLSAEIVVGTTPGGELGGTWASPTVDATHSGSTHSAATDTHIADAVDAHDASAVSFAPTGSIAATDVQAAIAELATDAGFHYELLMVGASPPEPLENGDGTDWLYVLVP